MKNTDHARMLSKGKSFEYSPWHEFVKYSNDCFKQDFVSYNNSLFACKKTHLSTKDNCPEFNHDDQTFNYSSEYWELITASVPGTTPMLKIEDEYWYTSYDDGITWNKVGKAISDKADLEWGEY